MDEELILKKPELPFPPQAEESPTKVTLPMVETVSPFESTSKDDDDESTPMAEEYRKIITELEFEENDLRDLCSDCVSLSKNIKGKLDVMLNPSTKANLICAYGIPDALNAYSRLMSTAISSKQQIMAIKKLKLSTIKDINSSNPDEDELSVL